MSEKKSGALANFFFVFANTVLFLLFANVLIAAILFLFGRGMSLDFVMLAIGLTIIFAIICSTFVFEQYILGFIFVLLAVAGVCAGGVFLNHTIYDISYDGQTYHQEAVIQLSHGWDPVYQYLDPNVIGPDSKWINYYPKSSWINEAAIFLLTNQERDAKALNIILIIIAIALVYAALVDADILGKVNAFAVAVLVACNPVAIYQSLSFYLDGQLMSLFLCLCAICLIIYSKKRPFAFVSLFIAIPVFINLKFTAVVDAVILLIVFMVALWMEENERDTFRVLKIGAVSIALGILVIGASPYITNTMRYGNPFYPLEGSGAIDLKPYNVPGNFINENSTEIFFASMFSQSANLKGVGSTSTFQPPFAYTPSELTAFRYPDPEEGGFGPLFGGAVALAFVMMLAYFIGMQFAKEKKYRGTFQAACLLILVAILFCVIDPIASLARYVPQGYLIAVIPIILFLSTRKFLPQLVGWLALIFLLLNNYLVANAYVAYNLQTSAEIAQELATLKADAEVSPILVYFNEFKSTRVMLQEAGINYITTADINACPKPGFRQLLPENTTEFCVATN
jgi:hypothetical protein